MNIMYVGSVATAVLFLGCYLRTRHRSSFPAGVGIPPGSGCSSLEVVSQMQCMKRLHFARWGWEKFFLVPKRQEGEDSLRGAISLAAKKEKLLPQVLVEVIYYNYIWIFVNFCKG